MKNLIKKFGYDSLVEECEKQHWRIPTSEEVSNTEIDYDLIWVSDPCFTEGRAVLYNPKEDRVYLSNRNHMHYAVVIKLPCRWVPVDFNYFQTDCGNAFDLTNDESLEENGFKYCMYCGSEIEVGL